MNRHRERERGYVLFGIAIGLVILGISMTAAVPLWQKVMQRERERELIFRGYQYMQAIELYQKKYPAAYPADIDVLVKEKFLRKAYTDPFSKDGEGAFRILRQMSPELQQGALAQQRAAGQAAGITGLNRSQARMRTPGGQSISGSAGGRFQSTLGRGASDASMGGIVGVASASDEETFYKVPGKEKYKDWLFVYGAQQAGIGQVGQAGQAGLGQIGQAGQAGQARQRQPRVPTSQFRQQQAGRGGQLGGQQRLPGQNRQNASPFQGLPPPPGFTSFRFGAAGGARVPGQVMPGQPGTGLPGQPSFGNPGAGSPGQSGFGQAGAFGQRGSQQRRQPQQQQPRRQPR